MTGHHKKMRKTSGVLANRCTAITLSLGAALGVGAAGAAPAMASAQPRTAAEAKASDPDMAGLEGALSTLSQNSAKHTWCRDEPAGTNTDATKKSSDVKGLLHDLMASPRLVSQNLKHYTETTAKDGSQSGSGNGIEDVLKKVQSGELGSDASGTLKQEVSDLSSLFKQITDLMNQIGDQLKGKADPTPDKPVQHECGDPGTQQPGQTGTVGGWQPVKVTDPRIQRIATWAVGEANREQHLTGDAAYHLVSVQSAETQVVSGLNYRLLIRVDRPSAQVMEAVVNEVPWENVHHLTSFQKAVPEGSKLP